MASWLTRKRFGRPAVDLLRVAARCVRWTDTPVLSPPARLPVRDRSRAPSLKADDLLPARPRVPQSRCRPSGRLRPPPVRPDSPPPWPPWPTGGSTSSSTAPRPLDPPAHRRSGPTGRSRARRRPRRRPGVAAVVAARAGHPLHDHGDSSAPSPSSMTHWPSGSWAGAAPAPVTRLTELTGGRVRHFGPHYVHQVISKRPGRR